MKSLLLILFLMCSCQTGQGPLFQKKQVRIRAQSLPDNQWFNYRWQYKTDKHKSRK